MTPEQMTALAARLQKAANERGNLPDDSEALAADLDTAADLIEQMAQRVPLTEQEIWDAVEHGVIGGIGLVSKAVKVARAIEEAHGIRSEK